MYSSVDVANCFLKLAEKEGEEIRTMKLLKLTYIAHGFHLGFFDNPLIKEEIEAWKYGPVIPKLYFIIKKFGKKAVPSMGLKNHQENKLNEETHKFVALIWDAYKKFSGYQLSGLTHRENTPWHQVYKKDESDILIPNPIISDFYKILIRERKIG